MNRYGSRWMQVAALVAVVSGLFIGRANALTPNAVKSGELLLATDNAGEYLPALQQDSNVEIHVTGPVARTRLRQRFTNPADVWVEGLYAFPLPENAAVDRLRMIIGDRIVEGQIQEKAEAQRIYQAARDAGQRASLVESLRPNLFTTRVANIPPRGEIEVEIEFQQLLAWRDGRYSLRFPLAVTPRYSPPPADPEASLPAPLLPGGVQIADETDAQSGWLSNPVELAVFLDAGFDLAQVHSDSHPIEVRQISAAAVEVHLADGVVASDRDFQLDWWPVPAQAPRATYFVAPGPDADYGLLLVVPPDERFDSGPVQPREVVFVVDTSGSMGGESMRAAKAALDSALARLGPADTFDVVRFSSDSAALFPAPVAADAGNKSRAQDYVAGFEADGGTDMRQALELVFAMPEKPDRARVRQLVFITDGAVDNEAALFELIHEHLGDRRLFTIGIGSAPNAYFMTEAARFGRGSHTYIANLDELHSRMDELFARLERPALTDIALTLPVAADLAPDPIPDLYAGEPIAVIMRLDAPVDRVRLDGRIGVRPWAADLDLRNAAEGSGLDVLWAREKIDGWMRAASRGEDHERVRAEVIALALEHHLVSAYTSLVAVDVTPVRSQDAPLNGQAVRATAPIGFAQGATPSALLMLIGFALSLAGLGGFASLRRVRA